jgi:MFS transporter, FSR family, fosmidomycin resistance protein
MRPLIPARRRLISGVILAALAVELVDELVGGTQGAAMPLIRHDLALSYAQIGLLAATPLIVGSLIELPVGVIAGTGRRRRLITLGGGLLFIAALAGAAAARNFAELLLAFVAFFPASGAFVSLTQSALMDADPARRPQHMARWTLAGSVGAVSGPLVVAAVLAAGGTWRLAYLLLAVAATAAWLGLARLGHPESGGPDSGHSDSAQAEPGVAESGDPDAGLPASGSGKPGARLLRAAAEALTAARQGPTIRWLTLLQVSDLLLDVLTGFLALYLVAVVHVSPALAALGVAVRLGAGLGGDLLLIMLLERFDPLRVLRVGVIASGLLYPAFLLLPGLGLKLLAIAALSLATAPFYPVMQAQMYASLPGQSGLAVSLSSAASLVGGLGPLAVGLLAERFGLSWALAVLVFVPLILLVGCARARGQRTLS